MRYSANHKAEIREKLIQAAGALSKEQGFGVTGVDALMSTIGLSGAAFYGHFKTKSDLLEAIIGHELNATRNRFLAAVSPNGEVHAAPVIRAYLNRAHLEHPDIGCALPSLSSEVARANDKVKQTYEDRLQEIHLILTDALGDQKQAWALLALAVGAINLGRAMKSQELQQTLLDSCVDLALAEIDRHHTPD